MGFILIITKSMIMVESLFIISTFNEKLIFMDFFSFICKDYS